jgi:uncharacterized protein YkwD
MGRANSRIKVLPEAVRCNQRPARGCPTPLVARELIVKPNLLALVLTSAFLAGCPFNADEPTTTPYHGGSGGVSQPPPVGPPAPATNSGENPGRTTGGNAGGSTSQTDPLEAEFPGCMRPVNASTWRQEVLELINEQRTSYGLPALSTNPILESQAEHYACEMIHYGFFGHENPVTGSTLRDRAAEFGYSYMVIGENLAAGQDSPFEVVNDWMNSPGHRANILGEHFTEAGVGVRAGGVYGLYWVVEFGQPWP